MSTLWRFFWPTLAFLATSGAALTARAVMLASLRRWPGSGLVAPIVASIRGPSGVWCVLAGLHVGNEAALDLSLLSAHWHDRVTTLLEVAAMVSVTIVLAAIAGQAVARVSERSAVGGGVTGLAQTTSRATVLTVGLLVLLSALGVQIAPLLTALGVGGLAVALALQDTLGNMFLVNGDPRQAREPLQGTSARWPASIGGSRT